MVIVRFKGGLGNQLFQYGLYRNLELLGKDVRADISDYEENRDSRDFLLRDIGIKLDYANANDTEKYRGKLNSIIEIVRRKYGLRKSYFGEKEDIFDKKIFLLDNIYLDGYWQNELYFKEIESEIREELINLLYQNDSVKKTDLKNRIESENSIAVHIRRGDYIKKNSIYTNLSKSDYYDKAIDYIRNKIENPIIYLFSDDTEWVKQKFKGKEFAIVEDYEGKSEQEDLILMSKCKHNIIANSSYSWWAAWINCNNEKIVIAPKEWFSINKKTNIVCSSWLTI